jgi:hypothetical protein
MSFQIIGLSRAEFAPLFALTTAQLAARGIVRRVADQRPGFPCRVSLQDAQIGESVLLLNYEHLPGPGPYRSRHAVFVRENATEAALGVNEIPESLQIRLLSVRAFDAAGMMTAAEVVPGTELAPLVERILADEATACLHLHNARPGCFAARVTRV